MLIEILEELNEGRAESGQGSKAGREKYASRKGAKSKSVKSRKSRVRIFPTIRAALKSAAPFGTMFSTQAADRIYVISHKKGGTDKKSQVGVRIAKGFTPGSATPNASWPSIKSHSIRTSIRHGGVSSSRLKKKYGAGEHRPEEKRYAGKPSVKKANEEVNPWAACNVSVGTKKTSKRERCIMHIKRKQGVEQTDPSLREKLAHLAEQPQSVGTLLPRTIAGSGRIKGPTSGRLSKPPHKQVKRSESRKGGGVKRPHEMEPLEHTEHEGPTLAEQVEYIAWFIEEGKRWEALKAGVKKLGKKAKSTAGKALRVGAIGLALAASDPTQKGGGDAGDDVPETGQSTTAFIKPDKPSQKAQRPKVEPAKGPPRGGRRGPSSVAPPRARRDWTEHEGPTLREKLAHLAEIAVRAESSAEKTARQKEEAMKTAEETLRRKQAERKQRVKALRAEK